jgi:hypothetical protein
MALATYFPADFMWSMLVPQEPGNETVTTAQHHAAGRHTYSGVLPGAPTGSFPTLLSPLPSHARFGTMPYTLATVDQNSVRRPRVLTSP